MKGIYKMSFDIKKAEYFFLITAGIVGICYLLSQYGNLVLGILFPFILSGICAHFLSPPAEYLREKLHMPKWAACIFITSTFFAALFTFAYIIISRLLKEISGLSQYAYILRDNIPGYIDDLKLFVSEKFPFFQAGDETGDFIISSLGKIAYSVAGGIAGYISEALPAVFSFIPNFFIGAIITILATYYFTLDLKKIKRFFLFQLPSKLKIVLSECRIQFFDTISKYFGAYAAIAMITFAELLAGLMFIRRDYAFIIALATTLVDILPVFGSGAVLLPWAAAEYAFGNRPDALKILILYIIITAVRQIIEPKILGTFTGLDPLTALLVIFAGAKIMGILGIFIFPVIAIIIKNLNDKNIIKIFKTPPEDTTEKISSARLKYRRFKKNK